MEIWADMTLEKLLPTSVKRGSRIGVSGHGGGICDVPFERLEGVCREFEAIFLQELLKVMRRTVVESQGTSKAIYQGLMDQELARLMAKRGIGLAELMLQRLMDSCMGFPTEGTAEAQVLADAADMSDGTL